MQVARFPAPSQTKGCPGEDFLNANKRIRGISSDHCSDANLHFLIKPLVRPNKVGEAIRLGAIH